MRAINLARVATAFKNIGVETELDSNQLNIIQLRVPIAASVESGQLLVLAADWDLELDNTPEVQRDLFFRINDFHRKYTRIKIAMDTENEHAVLSFFDVISCHPGLSDSLLELTLQSSLGGLIHAAYELSSQIPGADVSPAPTTEWGGV